MFRVEDVIVFGALSACSGCSPKAPAAPVETADTDAPADYAPVCADPGRSSCGNDASIVRGTVRLAPGLETENTRGYVVLTLTHGSYDGDIGGGYHTSVTLEDVDLAAGPVPFELDMCDDGEMWSEENCDYGLLAVLDVNGNNFDGSTQLPDAGEPATRYAPLDLSCEGESPCLDIVLDCLDGASCVTFTPPRVCACADESCGSDYALCH